MVEQLINKAVALAKRPPLYAAVLFATFAIWVASPLVNPITTGVIAEYLLLTLAVSLFGFRYGRELWELSTPLAEAINQRKEVDDDRTESDDEEGLAGTVHELPSRQEKG